ncbi:MAG TPA: mechanosensitive ion channel domain-containing protein [Allosphingosinicella sp.]|jgi:small-conductance mechanosensitive channel
MNTPARPSLFDNWHRLVAWIGDHSVDLATAAGMGILFVLALIGLRGIARRLLGGSEARGWRKVAEGVVARTYLFFILMAAAKLVSLQVALPTRLEDGINILFVIAAALQVAIWTRALIIGWIESRVGQGEEHRTLGTAMGLIKVLVTVGTFLIAIIVILDNLGVNVTGLVAGLGIGGIAIGLAAQGIFKDLFAALAIIFDRPFRKGDTINFGGANGFTGTVENIGLRTVRLRALDGEMVAVGNDKLLQDRIHNYAILERRRGLLNFSLPPNISADLLARVPGEMQAVVAAQPGVTFDRAHLVRFGLASADFEIVFHMDAADYGALADARQAIIIGLVRRLAELGIEVAPAPAPAPAAPALDKD